MFEITSVICSELAAALPAEVVSVDYSLSPEAIPGTALRECTEVFEALAPGRFTLLGGDSAGGNIAAAEVLKLSRDPEAIMPGGVFLFYPLLDILDHESPAYKRFCWGYGLDHSEILAYVKAYDPDTTHWPDPLCSPIYGDVGKYPPTLMITAQFDPLRDQGKGFAKKLEAAGRSVRYKCIRGTIHGCACREGFDKARAEIVNEVEKFYELIKGA
jgi:acetyl esterase